MSRLTKFLGIGVEANDQLVAGVEEVKTVTEFLDDAVDKVPELLERATDLSDRLPDLLSKALETSAPWLTGASEVLGDALPPVKAVLTIAKFLTRETDPYALGLLACSLAYQSALASSLKEAAADPAVGGGATLKRAVRFQRDALGKKEEPEAFIGFRLDSPLGHPLIRQADAAVYAFTSALGFPENLQRRLIEGVHLRFPDQFRALISDGKVKDKFDPLFRLLELGGKEISTYAVLQRHIDYQLWRFKASPVLGSVGSSSMRGLLGQVFEPLDCGSLHWGEIRASGAKSKAALRRTPFDEDFGGRAPLTERIIDLIGRREFNDAIIVQGTAGAGKSVSMMHLCTVLRQRYLRPIRIRMRDLSLDQGTTLYEDMALAIAQNSGDEEYDALMGPRPSAQDMEIGQILNESIRFGDATISPYVFIFDGWDEISISASEGFRIRIENTLAAIRRWLLSGHPHHVRVILTGRPSDDVNEAKFLRAETPVLTLRPFRDAQFGSFVDSLVHHHFAALPEVSPPADIGGRVETLKRQFAEDERSYEDRGRNILGLPLLALLAVWLVLNDRDLPEDMLAERSSLYRRLVDLTTREGGNIEQVGPAAARITGPELRDLLQRTAAAMTLRGAEHISYDELLLRLEAGGLDLAADIVDRAAAEGEMAKLMLSFFFNTGNSERGCEFIHKSFREYLFAEAIVEALKRIGEPPKALTPRSAYWKEFDDGDPMRANVEEIGLLLGPQWLSSEVSRHLTWLIGWEIKRATKLREESPADGESVALDIAAWQRVRDRLVQLWDWWADGVHLRPQPFRPKGKNSIDFEQPYAARLIMQMAPTELPRGALPEPVRTTTVDAHLGDALFRLNCALHFKINEATGWIETRSTPAETAIATWEGAGTPSSDGRRYQTRIRRGEKEWLAFAPSTPDGVNQFLEFYISRINAAGWLPSIRFPMERDLSGVDLKGAEVRAMAFYETNFQFARFEDADFEASIFIECTLKNATGMNCAFNGAQFGETDIFNGDWTGADFENSILKNIPDMPVTLPEFMSGAYLLNEDSETTRLVSEVTGD